MRKWAIAMAREVCAAQSLFASARSVDSTMSADTMHVDDSLLSSIEDANMRVFIVLIAPEFKVSLDSDHLGYRIHIDRHCDKGWRVFAR